MVFIKLVSILALLSTSSHAASVKAVAAREDEGAPKLLRGGLVGMVDKLYKSGGVSIAVDDALGTNHCGCEACSQTVWDTRVTDAGGTHTCGARIDWLKDHGDSEADACSTVASEVFSNGSCAPCECKLEPTHCGCEGCTQTVWDTPATDADGPHTCGARIDHLKDHGDSEADACSTVASEVFSSGSCAPCECDTNPTTPSNGGGGGGSGDTIKAMSYNTEYSGYSDGRVPGFADHIRYINADVVGLQECQNANLIASLSGYNLLPNGGWGDNILYKGSRLQALDSGNMSIPKDEHAERYISYGKFRVIGTDDEFWIFNTHLPHRSLDAADQNTHARIARMLLAKREELGAGNTRTIITGDCNPFASSGAPEGSFESNLVAGGMTKVYQATGSTGGHQGLDKIFASHEWTSWANGADLGQGGSDHPAIAADFTF